MTNFFLPRQSPKHFLLKNKKLKKISGDYQIERKKKGKEDKKKMKKGRKKGRKEGKKLRKIERKEDKKKMKKERKEEMRREEMRREGIQIKHTIHYYSPA